MEITTSFKAGEIICPVPADYTLEYEELVLSNGLRFKHQIEFNATIISHFIIAINNIDVGEEVKVNLNTMVYDSDKNKKYNFPGFKNLTEEEKQNLYIYADESVRKQAILNGFIPHRSESGINVIQTPKFSLIAVSNGSYKAQTTVFTSTGVLLPFPVRSTIELPGEQHLRLTGGSEFIRHACEPNLQLEIEGNAIRGIALRDIEKGECLTYNYLYTEWDIAQPFHCDCNTNLCYKFIRGFRYLDAEKQVFLLPNASEAIKEKYNTPSPTTASLTLLQKTTCVALTYEGKLVSQRYVSSGTVLFHVNRVRSLPREIVLDNLCIPHSCDANSVLLGGRLIVSRSLLAGDPVTFNICTLFYELPLHFKCNCGSNNCSGIIKGFDGLNNKEKNRIMPFTEHSIVSEALRRGCPVESSSPLVKITRDPFIGGLTNATNFIPKGTRIFHIKGLILPFPTIYTVLLEDGKHLLFAEGAQCLAHSCNPNTRLSLDVSMGIANVIAIRDINNGEVISFNYLTSEWEMAAPFKCGCGSKNCYGMIRGFRFLDENTQLRIWPQTTAGVKSLLAQHRRSALLSLDNSLVYIHESSGELRIARDLPSGIIIFNAINFRIVGNEIYLDGVKIKHSCNPTVVWLDGKVVLCNASLRDDIVSLNINHIIYNTTPFICSCELFNCVGEVRGFSALNKNQKDAAMVYVNSQVRTMAIDNGYIAGSSSPLVEIKLNGLMGQATFAKHNIKKGTRFFKVTGLILPFPTMYTILIEDKKHLLFADGAQCLAHSCNPCVRIITDNIGNKLECIALRDIKQGEVISFNYLTTEWDMQSPFTCLCGASNCYRDIRGFKHLEDDLRQNLWNMTTTAIKSLVISTKNIDAWAQIASTNLFVNNSGIVCVVNDMIEGILLINISCVEVRNGLLYIDGLRIRHNCSPSAAVIENKIVLIHSISAGEEINVDINCLIYSLPEEFICNCNTFNESHIIRGFKWLKESEKHKRIVFTESSVRAAALRDGYSTECNCSLVKIKNSNRGLSIFAKVNINAGTRFMNIKGLCIPFPTSNTIQIEENKHLLLYNGAQFISHSCEPNIRIRVDSMNGTIECEALHDIGTEEIIAYNYVTTEWDLHSPFQCLCKSLNCLHNIHGFNYLSNSQRLAIQGQVTPIIHHLANGTINFKLPFMLKANSLGMLQVISIITRGTVLLEYSNIDIQPTQVSLCKDSYIIRHNENANTIFVEGRFIAKVTIEEGEILTVDMNLFVYDMKTLFPRAFIERGQGFYYLNEETKQKKLYLCEPAVRAQAMRDGWIVKSSSPLIKVQPNGEMGQTAYATENIKQGTILFHISGFIIPFPTMYTICVGESQHLLFGDAAECIAHHCDPNIQVIIEEESMSLQFITIKPICAGEMLTFNYCTTEWVMNTPFVCLCGSQYCAGTIRGFINLSKIDRQRLWPITSPVVRRFAGREGL